MKKTLARLLLAVLGVGAIAALAFWLYRRPPTPIPVLGSEPLTIKIASPPPYYLQTDPRWAHEPLGSSPLRMADSGCVVSSVSMALSAAGQPVTPLELVRSLNSAQGFTPAGLLLWRSVETVSGGQIQVLFPRLSHKTIDASLHEGTPVIAKVLLSPTVPHWVLIVGKQDQDYLVMDPLNRKSSLVQLSSLSANIQAIRVIQRKRAA